MGNKFIPSSFLKRNPQPHLKLAFLQIAYKIEFNGQIIDC